MLNSSKILFFGVTVFFAFTNYSCSDEPYVAVEYSPVNYNLGEMPYDNLSEYNFFQGEMKDLSPVYGVIPYELISSLFTDYSIKNRFLWMPDGVTSHVDIEICPNNLAPTNSTTFLFNKSLKLPPSNFLLFNFLLPCGFVMEE